MFRQRFELRTPPGYKSTSFPSRMPLKVKCLSKFEVLTAVAMRIQVFAVSYPHKTYVLDIYRLVRSSVVTSFCYTLLKEG